MSVRARPIHPARPDSAPRATNTTVATTCQTMWWKGSSDVNHPAKNEGTDVASNGNGRSAFNVNSRPMMLTTRNSVGISGSRWDDDRVADTARLQAVVDGLVGRHGADAVLVGNEPAIGSVEHGAGRRRDEAGGGAGGRSVPRRRVVRRGLCRRRGQSFDRFDQRGVMLAAFVHQLGEPVPEVAEAAGDDEG